MISLLNKSLLSLAFFSFALAAAEPPALSGRVVDSAGVLSAADKALAENAIRALEAKTGGQMAVLIVKSLDGGSIEDLGIKTAEKWKIGRAGMDNGAIFLAAIADKKMRIEVGLGWEGALNDAKAGDIIREIGPLFREGKYGAGISLAVKRVQSAVSGADDFKDAIKKEPKKFVKIAVLFVVIALLAIFLSGRHNYYYGRTYGGCGSKRSGIFGGISGGRGGGSFRGGGGSFGGGGASGGW